MNPKPANNCEELRSRFEGREALYVDKGVLRVRDVPGTGCVFTIELLRHELPLRDAE